MINYNFHTHHYRCQHAEGEIRDYVEAAIQKGLKYIGISCHVPDISNQYIGDRMGMASLDVYLEEIEALKEEYKKDITVLTAFECEYNPEYRSYYEELRERCDYLVLGQHYIENKEGQIEDVFEATEEYIVREYAKQVSEAADTGIFDFIAHPDGYVNKTNLSQEVIIELAEIILEAARRNNLMIEYNANGYRYSRKYPYTPFFEYVKSNYDDIRILINSDAHSPDAIHDEYIEYAYKRANEMGLNLAVDGKEFIQHISKEQREASGF